MAKGTIQVTIEYGGGGKQETLTLTVDEWFMAQMFYQVILELAQQSQSFVRTRLIDIRGVTRQQWRRPILE